MEEERKYPPAPEFVSRAHVQGPEGYRALYKQAEENPEQFWGDQAEKEIFWFEKWANVLEWDPPFAKWFTGGKTNVSYNCLDRHVHALARTRPPSSGRASQATSACSPTRSCTGWSAASPTF